MCQGSWRKCKNSRVERLHASYWLYGTHWWGHTGVFGTDFYLFYSISFCCCCCCWRISVFAFLKFFWHLCFSTWLLYSPNMPYWTSRDLIISLNDLSNLEHSFIHEELQQSFMYVPWLTRCSDRIFSRYLLIQST